MKQAWQPVASVAMSTIPPSTRSRSSEEETVLMTAYRVSFSRRALRSAPSTSASATDCTVKASPPFSRYRAAIVFAAARVLYVRTLPFCASKYVLSAYCGGAPRGDMLPPVGGS